MARDRKASRAAAPSLPNPAGSSFAIPAANPSSATTRWIDSGSAPATSGPEQVGGESRTIVVRPDGSQIITVSGRDGELLRRIRRDPEGREIIIIDNTYRDPAAVGGFYVDLPPPVIGIPYDRYIVDADDASPELIYDTMEAPPVDRIARRYSLTKSATAPRSGC